MLNCKSLAIAFCATLTCLVFVPSPAEAQQISGAEFTSTHSGRCVAYSGPSVGTQCFAADGTTNYDDRSYGKDTGHWEVRGNDVCTNWKKEPGWDCGPISKAGPNSFSDGEYTWQLN